MDVERRDPSLSGAPPRGRSRSASSASVNGVWASASTPASRASRVIPSPSTWATTGSPRSRALATTAASVAASKTGPELRVQRDLDDGCAECRLLVHRRRRAAADARDARDASVDLAHDLVGSPRPARRVAARRREEGAGICHARNAGRSRVARATTGSPPRSTTPAIPPAARRLLVDEVQVDVVVDERRQRDAVLARDGATPERGLRARAGAQGEGVAHRASLGGGRSRAPFSMRAFGDANTHHCRERVAPLDSGRPRASPRRAGVRDVMSGTRPRILNAPSPARRHRRCHHHRPSFPALVFGAAPAAWSV